MNLLPKTTKEFSSEEYWSSFFKKREKAFEWYGNYLHLKVLLHKYVKHKDSLLVVGCGNSSLGYELYSNGIVDNVNIDISELVVKQMTRKFVNDKTNGLKFVKMDATNMNFDNESFSVVLDKGTLDAIVADGSETNLHKADAMFREIDRVLKTNGRYICVSLLQSHVLTKIMSWFKNYKTNYVLRIHRCFDAEHASRIELESSVIFPVFIIVCTKLQKNLSFPFELYLSNDVNVRSSTTSSVEDLTSQIHSLQEYAILEHRLKSKTLPHESEICIQLFNESNQNFPRYSLFVLDMLSKVCTIKYAIFIVPDGQEMQWLFGTPEGRRELAKMSRTQRLCVVHLNRNHSYVSLQAIQDELSSRVMDFAPKGMKHSQGKPVPFLSVGSDVGSRVIRHQGKSELSGEYVVEDVSLPNNETFRRLIFMSNQNIIQSEIKVIEAKGQQLLDYNYLSCRHHYALFAGIVLQSTIKSSEDLNILLIGLGGGCFPTFVQRNLLHQNSNLEVVEIDDEMVKVAKNFFGFREKKIERECININVHVDNGITFIQNKSKSESKCYDVVIFDVDSKDIEKGLSCPPEDFVEKKFLECVRNLLKIKGLFILNLVARNNLLKQKIKNDIKCLFSSVYSYEIPQEINEVLYCFTEPTDCVLFDKDKYESIENSIKNIIKYKKISDISECIAKMKII
ncbi:methyltransferase-like protein 13 isoform X1 [Leptotrombidium deliense]|uniref:Methyltransferase-like protein 13 isoform X1 n=1 Tax=Leptotrombidium deliense TaxID=299467 RepID=A0A443S6I6_9ACAR|nr:methyltransferase-like protein 13 isoform X1 [Leptotrombidium deliense]